MSTATRFKVGDTIPGGQKVDHIFGQTNSVLVFRTPDQSISYYLDVDNLSEKDQEVLKRYDYLSNRIFEILPKREWGRFMDELGSALFNGFAVESPEKAVAAFDDVKRRIFERTSGYSRLIYLLSALVSATVLGLIFFGFYLWYSVAAQRVFALCIVFAIAGSLASVIQRTSSIEVGDYEQKPNLQIRGAFRIILGGLLAAFFVAASKANLLVGIAATSQWSFLAFSFLSGFSERFVPEMLDKLDEKTTAKLHVERQPSQASRRTSAKHPHRSKV